MRAADDHAQHDRRRARPRREGLRRARRPASLGHNLFTDGTCPTATSDLANTDPLLSGFQADATLPLLAGSPAINAGTNTDCPATDERGMPRPQNGLCDIGAYERRLRVKWWPPFWPWPWPPRV